MCDQHHQMNHLVLTGLSPTRLDTQNEWRQFLSVREIFSLMFDMEIWALPMLLFVSLVRRRAARYHNAWDADV